MIIINHEELEKKLLDTVQNIQKINDYVQKYEKDIEKLRIELENLNYRLEDTLAALRSLFIVILIMFVIISITWFFPFQVENYGYLTMEDVRRKIVAISVEILIFGFIVLFSVYLAISRRFRK